MDRPAPRRLRGCGQSACAIIDIGMTKLCELMKEGRIVSKRVDGIRLINLA